MLISLLSRLHHGFDIGHMVVSSVVHGVVYASIYKLMHGLSTTVVVCLSVSIVIFAWLIFRRR